MYHNKIFVFLVSLSLIQRTLCFSLAKLASIDKLVVAKVDYEDSNLVQFGHVSFHISLNLRKYGFHDSDLLSLFAIGYIDDDIVPFSKFYNLYNETTIINPKKSGWALNLLYRPKSDNVHYDLEFEETELKTGLYGRFKMVFALRFRPQIYSKPVYFLSEAFQVQFSTSIDSLVAKCWLIESYGIDGRPKLRLSVNTTQPYNAIQDNLIQDKMLYKPHKAYHRIKSFPENSFEDLSSSSFAKEPTISQKLFDVEPDLSDDTESVFVSNDHESSIGLGSDTSITWQGSDSNFVSPKLDSRNQNIYTSFSDSGYSSNRPSVTWTQSKDDESSRAWCPDYSESFIEEGELQRKTKDDSRTENIFIDDAQGFYYGTVEPPSSAHNSSPYQFLSSLESIDYLESLLQSPDPDKIDLTVFESLLSSDDGSMDNNHNYGHVANAVKPESFEGIAFDRTLHSTPEQSDGMNLDLPDPSTSVDIINGVREILGELDNYDETQPLHDIDTRLVEEVLASTSIDCRENDDNDCATVQGLQLYDNTGSSSTEIKSLESSRDPYNLRSRSRNLASSSLGNITLKEKNTLQKRQLPSSQELEGQSRSKTKSELKKVPKRSSLSILAWPSPSISSSVSSLSRVKQSGILMKIDPKNKKSSLLSNRQEAQTQPSDSTNSCSSSNEDSSKCFIHYCSTDNNESINVDNYSSPDNQVSPQSSKLQRVRLADNSGVFSNKRCKFDEGSQEIPLLQEKLLLLGFIGMDIKHAVHTDPIELPLNRENQIAILENDHLINSLIYGRYQPLFAIPSVDPKHRRYVFYGSPIDVGSRITGMKVVEGHNAMYSASELKIRFQVPDAGNRVLCEVLDAVYIKRIIPIDDRLKPIFSKILPSPLNARPAVCQGRQMSVPLDQFIKGVTGAQLEIEYRVKTSNDVIDSYTKITDTLNFGQNVSKASDMLNVVKHGFGDSFSGRCSIFLDFNTFEQFKDLKLKYIISETHKNIPLIAIRNEHYKSSGSNIVLDLTDLLGPSKKAGTFSLIVEAAPRSKEDEYYTFITGSFTIDPMEAAKLNASSSIQDSNYFP